MEILSSLGKRDTSGWRRERRSGPLRLVFLFPEVHVLSADPGGCVQTAAYQVNSASIRANRRE